MVSKIRVIEEVVTRITGVNRSIVGSMDLTHIESARTSLNSQLEMLKTKQIENDALLDGVKKHISEAVSYTHLDVYKRQRIYRSKS